MATEIVIPFYNGQQTIDRLIATIPEYFPILIVDDLSDEKLENRWLTRKVRIQRLTKKGYFSGAVNFGFSNTGKNDVLVLNQDVWFDNTDWISMLDSYKETYSYIGERIKGSHPAFGELGYIHGTFAWFSRDAIEAVGLLNQKNYPLWGSTAEYQWRVARKNFLVLPLIEIPGFHHERPKTERFGSSIKYLLEKEPENKKLLVRTPPLVSVIVPCYNYGRYLSDCIHSLIGGKTCLGEMPGQTLQSFEIIIVDDASTDDSMDFIREIADPAKGIRAFQMEKNVGTARALNFGIEKAVGKYITFLSADDMREADSLEKLVEACEQNPHSFAYDDIWLVNKHQRVKKWQMPDYDFEEIIWKNHVHAGILFPKEAWIDVGGYPAIMGDGREDWAFNIALGIKGWCGVHVKEFGYLYRREGQNRTERNTTEAHRERFLSKIMDLFPEIYKGHRPMACCGKGSNTKKNIGVNSTFLTRSSSMQSTLVGAEGMVKIEYLGEQMSFTISGDATNAKYTFGKDRPKGWVAKKDLGAREGKVGFLSKRDRNGHYLFRQVGGDGEAAVTEPVSATEIVVEKVVEQPSGVVASAQISGVLGVVEKNIQAPELKKVSAEEESSLAIADIQPLKYNPLDMNVEEIKALSDKKLSREEWVQIYKAEMAGRNRKGAVIFMEELLGNWDDKA